MHRDWFGDSKFLSLCLKLRGLINGTAGREKGFEGLDLNHGSAIMKFAASHLSNGGPYCTNSLNKSL
jgi:hypothetical protein